MIRFLIAAKVLAKVVSQSSPDSSSGSRHFTSTLFPDWAASYIVPDLTG